MLFTKTFQNMLNNENGDKQFTIWLLQDVFYLIWDLPSILPILCLHHSQFQQRKLSPDEV